MTGENTETDPKTGGGAWRLAARLFCGLAALAGVAAIAVGAVVDFRSELDWTVGVKYLLMVFACYVFLHVAIKGKPPGWLDI